MYSLSKINLNFFSESYESSSSTEKAEKHSKFILEIVLNFNFQLIISNKFQILKSLQFLKV